LSFALVMNSFCRVTANSFAESASHFETQVSKSPKSGQPRPASSTTQADFVDTERVIDNIDGMPPNVHLDQIHPVLPSARGAKNVN